MISDLFHPILMVAPTVFFMVRFFRKLLIIFAVIPFVLFTEPIVRLCASDGPRVCKTLNEAFLKADQTATRIWRKF